MPQIKASVKSYTVIRAVSAVIMIANIVVINANMML